MPGIATRAHIARLTRSFSEQDTGLVGSDPLGFPGYREQISHAQRESDLQEACVWGWADIDGAHCALVAGDFSFLGGSMGVAVGEKVARAFDGARGRRLPVVTITASGGARMQEGMAALVQMAKTAEARRRHAAAGLAHIALLTSPTTGGVYASFASLADVILAEPGATIGFAGPRVVLELTGETPPPEMHTAEFAYAHGLIDAIVTPDEQRTVIARALRALVRYDAPAVGGARQRVAAVPGERASAWERVELVRDPARPRARQVIGRLLVEPIELSGDRTGTADDPRVVVDVGPVRGTDVINAVVVGQQATDDGRIRPQGFRKAVRAIELAGRLGLPVVTLIDTRGADPRPESEAGGVASAIARTFDAMLACPSPTLAVLIGEGGSGGALAMATADRLIAWENAVFSVIAPEGAAAILYRDASRAAEIAEQLKITTPDLVELGLVDVVVREPSGGAQADPSAAIDDLALVVAEELERLVAGRAGPRLRRRRRRWRSLGNRYLEQAPS